ncbi:aminoglycoside phosphotransferase family protein [Elongatibacter sediminis]|uniref:Aminoglycoside phosphotransferase family protein n=1 Tax=Elongatibacter sediminis TaxID=3119006 RepID=A0AAW9REY9_9GAMM
MVQSSPSAEPERVTCHAVIGHPEKTAFLAVQHADGWSVPTLGYAPGPIDYRAEMINDGMFRKYGLHTRVLRPLLLSGVYHCLEMELAGAGDRRLKAVWVGPEQYEKFRTNREGEPDPFARWLEDRRQHREGPPGTRPPWESVGWFDTASHWMEFQLDQLQMQATGSVEQHRIGSNAAALLRVGTSRGRVFLKAGYGRPPAEAVLTRALAKRWPDRVPAPLAVDDERNWMLTADLDPAGSRPTTAAQLGDCAEALGALMLESSVELDAWRGLGCPEHDLFYLDSLAQDPESLDPWLRAGGGRLDDDERDRLARVLDAHRAPLAELGRFGLPLALLHADFRADNLVLTENGPLVTDWADTVIGHPLFALETAWRAHVDPRTGGLRMPLHRGGTLDEQLAADEAASGERTAAAPIWEGGEDALGTLAERLLTPWQSLLPAERLREAFGIARRLFPLWNFSRLAEDVRWTEPGSPRHLRDVVYLQWAARRLIDGVTA